MCIQHTNGELLGALCSFQPRTVDWESSASNGDLGLAATLYLGE